MVLCPRQLFPCHSYLSDLDQWAVPWIGKLMSVRASSHLGCVECPGVAPTGKQSPSSYAGAEQEMQQRKLSGV